MNQFDPIVTGAFELAQTEALRRKNNSLTPHHLLWGLIRNPKSVTSKNLQTEKKIIEGVLDQEPTMEHQLHVRVEMYSIKMG